MSNSSKYYETLPNNFPDDLADSLMAAFNIESVDSKEEMPHFLDTLYQKGYQIVPCEDSIIDSKSQWFVKISPSDPKYIFFPPLINEEEAVFDSLEEIYKYNSRQIKDIAHFTKHLHDKMPDGVHLNIHFHNSEEWVRYNKRTLDPTIVVRCFRVK